MADPFSIAGSAVGVVSLGIKCCEDLVSFIGHVRGGDDEFSKISSRMEDLANTLEHLQTIVETARPLAGTSTSLVHAAIASCATALEEFSTKFPQSSLVNGPSRLSNLCRQWKTKLAYPFRREELMSMKMMIESFQQNLIIALSALQLYVFPLLLNFILS